MACVKVRVVDQSSDQVRFILTERFRCEKAVYTYIAKYLQELFSDSKIDLLSLGDLFSHYTNYSFIYTRLKARILKSIIMVWNGVTNHPRVKKVYVVLSHNIIRLPRVCNVHNSVESFIKFNKAVCKIPRTPSPNQERGGNGDGKLVCKQETLLV